MNDDRSLAYVLLAAIAYFTVITYFFESSPFIAQQINSTVIIALLLVMIAKLNKNNNR
ncbi:hypothetical protein SAMN05877753_102616 [Bacillus oleivorans]|uniref:Uncharacterized protein n=1 Tax=Bacillus oleivorans TaxID=1448271 RepID=A0A285CNP0_9BACI|nr:hypothetical protein [Bacillus oleivorans]SNX68603.1 hypothetical protein SAMN05877753_102616 [Bacillus oleivorans]